MPSAAQLAAIQTRMRARKKKKGGISADKFAIDLNLAQQQQRRLKKMLREQENTAYLVDIVEGFSAPEYLWVKSASNFTRYNCRQARGEC
jgi:hypothetical protein